MKPFAVMSVMLCAIAGAAFAPAGAQNAKLCDKPRQMEGFKTCADIDKAKTEGAFVLYSTDPEQGQVKLLASFNKVFPEIKTSYVRLQAGALYEGRYPLVSALSRPLIGRHLVAVARARGATAVAHATTTPSRSTTTVGKRSPLSASCAAIWAAVRGSVSNVATRSSMPWL